MLDLFRRGLSRKNGGGTLHTYATNISHLIRFCYANRKDFIGLNDNHFSLFIKTLIGERNTRRPERLARDSNSVIAIGRCCLEFLKSVGTLYGDDGLLGPSGRIVTEERTATIRIRGRPSGRNTIVRNYLHHHSFPTPDPKKKRRPISTSNIEKLYDVVEATSDTLFQRKRRYAMLKMLEDTGGRRSEVVALTVDSVKNAAQMSEPKLKLLTAKKRGQKVRHRFIPIFRHNLVMLLEFIEVNRKRVIRNTCGIENDDGAVFISETTGYKLRPNTVTQEVHILARAAGIQEQTCPQLFRHAFITNLFVALIEQHKIENPDDFRQALLDKESLKQVVVEFTGGADIDALDPYIHLAYAKFTNFQKIINAVDIGRLVESLRSTVHRITLEIKGGMPLTTAMQQLLTLAESVEADLVRLRE